MEYKANFNLVWFFALVSPYLTAIWSEGPRHCKEDTLLASKELSNVDFCLWAIMHLH